MLQHETVNPHLALSLVFLHDSVGTEFNVLSPNRVLQTSFQSLFTQM